MKAMDDTGQLFNDLIAAAPGFVVVRAEHVANHGEVLSHVLMADVRRWLAAAALDPADAPGVRAALDVLDAHLAVGSRGAQEVIILSFLEHLGMAAPEHGERALRDQLGPNLRAALDELETSEYARDPDSKILRHFEWPDGWLPDTQEDRDREPPT